jgi:hypothetical protein
MIIIEPKGEGYCKVFGEALDAAPFPGILTVEPLWIELVA